MYSCKKIGHDALAKLQIKGGQVTVPIVRVAGWGDAGIEDGYYTISGVSSGVSYSAYSKCLHFRLGSVFIHKSGKIAMISLYSFTAV